jgi:hypothetical protein
MPKKSSCSGGSRRKHHHRGGMSSLSPGAYPAAAMSGGALPALSPAAFEPLAAGGVSLGNEMRGGYAYRRTRAHKRRHRGGSHQRGGTALESALVPLSLFGLHRWFKGSKTARRVVKKIKKTSKRFL